MAEVDLIVCQHNRADLTTNLLNSVPDGVRVIMIDNGSTTEQRDELRDVWRKRNHAESTLICVPENLGYTKAVNIGLQYATAPFTILANNDTVLYPGGVERLLAHMDSDPRLAAVGPIYSDCDSSASIRNRSEREVLDDRSAWITLADLFDGEIDYDVPNGVLSFGLVMLRREAVKQVGVLDEQFEYGVDDDYCIRLTKRGWKLGIARDVYVTHLQRQTWDAVKGRDWVMADGDKALKLLSEKHRA